MTITSAGDCGQGGVVVELHVKDGFVHRLALRSKQQELKMTAVMSPLLDNQGKGIPLATTDLGQALKDTGDGLAEAKQKIRFWEMDSKIKEEHAEGLRSEIERLRTLVKPNQQYAPADA